jgi:hypothetical protein
MSLIQGAGMVANPFNDYSKTFKGIPEPKAADLVTKPKSEEEENKDEDSGNNNDENKE